MAHFRINSPKVIHQTFDTEVVVVNLESGTYYSLEGGGIEIWRMLRDERDADEIVHDLTRGRNGDAAESAEAIRQFVGELTREQLIVPLGGENGARANGGTPAQAISPGQIPPPLLRKFTDMQDLLLLDPIHELDEVGWPMRKQTSNGSA